jgi:fermentation-respiration switch protein FrsA (DUF1100 family)
VPDHAAPDQPAPDRAAPRPKALRRLVKLGVIVLCAMAFLPWIESAFLFHPRPAGEPTAIAAATPGLERWWHRSDQGPVEAFFVPGDGVSAEHPGPAVIYAHGNAEVIDPLPAWLVPYRRLGVSLLLPEYRGYGRSAGTPSQHAIRDDLIAFHDLLAARPEVDRARIIFHGVSLGGGVVAQLAAHRAPRALILQSTFTSVADIAWQRFRAPRFLLGNPFDTLAALRAVRAPALIFHGRTDEVIPFAHGEALHRALPDSAFVACTAGHNDLPPATLDYWGEIERFLRRIEVLRP